MAAIRLERLLKRYGEVVAVRNASLDIASGELFFLLGPSGCGKTTLLRCVAGFLRPDEGRIFLDGRDVTNVAPERRDTAMVFQGYALWPHMTVHDNVAFGLRVRNVGRAERSRRVSEALQRVHMENYAGRMPNELSGGQQQRVALARALAVKPRCLLLDEPLSNLDAKLRGEMRGQIQRICKEAGLTALYVTHDQKEALSIADRIAVMRDGCIAQVGDPRELYCRPKNRFVADFLGQTNFVPGTVRAVDNGTARIETSIGTLTSESFPADLNAGCEVLCSIRPEAFRFAPERPVSNMLRGHLRKTVYLGEVAEHSFEVERTLLKIFEIHPRRSAENLQTFGVEACDVVVLKE